MSDCTIDTDLEILIPDTYVENITERLSLYTQLDDLETDEELNTFALELQDRFGPIPPQVEDLFTTLRSRQIACQLGFEKLILKNEQMRLTSSAILIRLISNQRHSIIFLRTYRTAPSMPV